MVDPYLDSAEANNDILSSQGVSYPGSAPPDVVPSFAFARKKAALEARQAKIAQLVKNASTTATMPQGQMISGRYVAPSWSQNLNAAIQPALSRYAVDQEQAQLGKDQEEFDAADRRAAIAHAMSAPQGTPEQRVSPAVLDDEGNRMPDAVTPGVPVTPQQKIAWAEQGMHIPSRKDLLTKLVSDLTIQEPVREEVRVEKRSDREDRQAESRATLVQQQILAREQFRQRADDALRRSEDTRFSIQQRADAAREHNEAMQAIAQTRAEAAAAKAGQGKTMTSGTIKELGALEDNVSRIGTLRSEFKDEYGGLKGAAATIVGGIPGISTPASEWWRNYRRESELIERHALFGASLTAGEQKAWKDADITPSMNADEIARRLARREIIARKVFDNAVDRHHRAGYNARDVFGEPRSIAPEGNFGPPAAPATKIINGKTYVQRNGQWYEQ